MNFILQILSVGAIDAPGKCEMSRIPVTGNSVERCMANAPVSIAQWAGDNPKWVAMRWHCIHPAAEEQKT